MKISGLIGFLILASPENCFIYTSIEKNTTGNS